MVEKNPHKKEWERNMNKNLSNSVKKGDMYDERSQACKRLLDKYC